MRCAAIACSSCAGGESAGGSTDEDSGGEDEAENDATEALEAPGGSTDAHQNGAAETLLVSPGVDAGCNAAAPVNTGSRAAEGPEKCGAAAPEGAFAEGRTGGWRSDTGPRPLQFK